MTMTERERVLATISHHEPDRVPVVIGVSNGIKMETYRRLKKLLGIQAEDRYLYDWSELGTAHLDECTLKRLRSDVRGIHDRLPESVFQSNQNRPDHSPFIDDWGSGQIEAEPGVWYPGIHPLSEEQSIDTLDKYPWPDMNDPSRLTHVGKMARQLVEENRFAIMATPWLLFPLERAFALQGMDKFLLNLSLNPDFSQALLSRITELCKTLMGVFLNELGDAVDIIKIGDDLGTQDRLLISPKMYRKQIKPFHADYIAFIKDHTRAKILFHTDGDVFGLVEDFIEIGVDILNPIQTSAGKMANLEDLKKCYGKQLCFCGGIDSHRILPFGSPDDVRSEVRRVISLLGPGGGYMVAAVHTIMDNVPPENILAMVDAVEEFGYYPLK